MFYRSVLALLTFVVLALATAASARADVIQLFSRAQLTPGGATTDYPDPNPATIPAPVLGRVGVSTVTFTPAFGLVLRRENQGVGFFGNFPAGTELLVTENQFGTPVGPLTINFSLPVFEFGLDAQNTETAADATSLFTFSVFNRAGTAFTFTRGGPDTLGTFFLGARATLGDAITRVVISGASSLSPAEVPNAQNNFAIGPVTVLPIPEPTTMLLLGTGLVGAAAAGFRKRRQGKTQ